MFVPVITPVATGEIILKAEIDLEVASPTVTVTV